MIAIMKMSQKWNKIWDSLEFVTVWRFNWKWNRWKTYNKDENKKNKVKYFKIDKITEKQLLDYSEKTWLTQSKIIIDAIKFYFCN